MMRLLHSPHPAVLSLVLSLTACVSSQAEAELRVPSDVFELVEAMDRAYFDALNEAKAQFAARWAADDYEVVPFADSVAVFLTELRDTPRGELIADARIVDEERELAGIVELDPSDHPWIYQRLEDYRVLREAFRQHPDRDLWEASNDEMWSNDQDPPSNTPLESDRPSAGR